MADPRAVAERWIAAINDHDLDVIADCFDPEYEDEAPARRGEHLRGQAAVRENFARLLKDLADLRADLLGALGEGDTVWMEWRMQGTRSDGTPMEFVGVNIFQTRDRRFRRGRIYTELVREVGGLEGQLRRMTEGGSGTVPSSAST